MASLIDQLNSYMSAALTALGGGDYATALNNALCAQGIIGTLPKATRSAGSGGGEQSAAWDAVGIDNFIRRLRQQQGAGLGVQYAPVAMQEPVASADGDQYDNWPAGFMQ